MDRRQRIREWRETADSFGLELTLTGKGILSDAWKPAIRGSVDGFPVHAQLNVVRSGEGGTSYSVAFRVRPAGIPSGMSIRRRSLLEKALERLQLGRRLLTGDAQFDNMVSVQGDPTTVIPWLNQDRKEALVWAYTTNKGTRITGGEITLTLGRDERGVALTETIHHLVRLARQLGPDDLEGRTARTGPRPRGDSATGPLSKDLLTSGDVSAKLFQVAVRGYAEEEVDVFLDRIVKALREYEEGSGGDLKAIDVEERTFRVALRGYKMEEVDPFLDKAVETLRQYERRKIEELTPSVPATAVTGDGLEPPAAHPEAVTPADVEPPAIEPPTPERASTTTRLVVTRTGEQGGRPYAVMLDDRPIGKIAPGATERFEIPTGMHWVTVKTRKEQSNSVVIEPHQGDQITLRCGPASGEIDDLGRKLEGIILELVG